MDPTLSFIYNIFQIIIYASIVAIAVTRKIDRDYKTATPVVGLFLFFLADSVIIFMTEFLPNFMSWYDVNFIRTPSLKAVIFLGVGFFTLLFWSVLNGSVFTGVQGLLLFALGLWLLFVPLLTDGAVGAFLFYSGYQVFCIGISVFALRRLRTLDPDRFLIPIERFRAFLIVTILFSVLIVAEDSYVIFSVDNYDAAAGDLHIYYRSVSEDVLRFIYSGLAASLFVGQFAPRGAEYKSVEIGGSGAAEPVEPAGAEPDPIPPIEAETARLPGEYKRMKFARALSLTDREEEVLALLLDGKTNREIAAALHISVGTVKAHVHGIYRKSKITHRYELPALFASYNAADG